MTEQLKAAFNRAEKLPQEQQEAIAQMILDYLDEQEWDKLTSSPKGRAALKNLLAEAKQEIAAGQVEEIKGVPFDS
jgi:hypothetical protein